MSENGTGETRGPAMAAGGLRPSDVDFMPPLLRSLSALCRLRGKALSPQFLLAGLSGSTVSAQACLRVARKAGLTGSQLVPLDALQEEYTGYALYVAVPGRPQEHVEKLRLAKGKRWFWDVLRY